MAVTWAVEIEVIDLATKAVLVKGTRTDDALPAEDGVLEYTVEGAYDTVNNTPAQLLQIYADALWDKHQYENDKETQIDAITSQAEAALKAELESRET